MSENTNNIVDTSQNEEVNTQNIFEDFENDLNLKEELNKADDYRKKDKIYYIKISTLILKYINILLLLAISILGIYIYVENDKEMTEKDFLKPFCNLLVGENGDKLQKCSSVSYLILSYQKKLEKETNKQYDILVGLLEQDYKNKNFLKSKNVEFIIDETSKKLSPITLLAEFDRVKKKILYNEFSVQCNNINIKGDIMNLTCNAYSFGYEDINIVGGKSIKGTSISVASAFYTNIDREGTFKVIEKQAEFSSAPYISGGDFSYFTNSTPFTLSLKYNNKIF